MIGYSGVTMVDYNGVQWLVTVGLQWLVTMVDYNGWLQWLVTVVGYSGWLQLGYMVGYNRVTMAHMLQQIVSFMQCIMVQTPDI